VTTADANPATIDATLGASVVRLAGSATPQLDAELLLAAVLGISRTQLRTWPDRPVAAAPSTEFDTLVTRRAAGEPVAYLLGQQEFWSLQLRVTTATLVPRPETELLVDMALTRLPRDARLIVADLGTGSGAIALALAHERPHCRIVATDNSPAALAVASDNAARLNAGNVDFVHGNWLEPLAGQRFAVIVSNPPYVAPDDPHLRDDGLRFEPATALIATDHGLADLRNIITTAHKYLEAGGSLLLEHGYDQGHAVRSLLADNGYRGIETVKDGAGIERVTMAVFH
jgi:release factor glutamine methyltransferase